MEKEGQLSPEKLDEILQCALLASRVLLQSGAETYRAEESAMRICQRFGIEDVQVMALPTGTFITVSRAGEVPVSALKRVSRRAVNHTRIDSTNRICRALSCGDMGLAQAMQELEALCNAPPPPLWLTTMAAGLSSGFFAVLFGGRVVEFIATFLCGLLVQQIKARLERSEYSVFIMSLVGGMCAALVAVLTSLLPGRIYVNAIISGAIMPLLPGLAMTNSMRDTMRGDLVSGVARAGEVLLIAVSLAAGVGAVLGLYKLLGGTLL